ncbi:MAG TPA: class II aldolase/adducin family protein [Usitatibacteraceae bacterium]|nr:class II aldolase/adducin family protein [Usitatibacteraceae bacterium]
MSEPRLRERIVETAQRMNTLGINHGSSGNVSARVEGGFLVTPSAVPYDRLTPGDIVRVSLDGHPTGHRAPSSEWRFHRDIYAKRPEAGAVVHTHSTAATALACLHRPIPPFHYEVAFAGGEDIRCARYETFGTQALSDAALEALEGRKACLLANHGAIAFGPGLDEALALADKVEALARQYLAALAVGEPVLLQGEKLAEAIAKISGYGLNATPSP